MERFEDKTFTASALAKGEFPLGIYSDCRFNKMELSSFDLRDYSFIECLFSECDLSNANVEACSFKDVRFHTCKLLGLDFSPCNKILLQMEFEDCLMDFCSLAELKLKKTEFRNCSLREADFNGTDLSECEFDGCDLDRAIFHFSVLNAADLLGSQNIRIDPDFNQLKGTKVSAQTALRMLDKYGLKIS